MTCAQILLIIYLIGCALSYPRMIASFYEIDERYPTLKPANIWFEIIISMLSWLAVISGIIKYFNSDEKYFWKWSKSDLHKKYRIQNPADNNE